MESELARGTSNSGPRQRHQRCSRPKATRQTWRRLRHAGARDDGPNRRWLALFAKCSVALMAQLQKKLSAILQHQEHVAVARGRTIYVTLSSFTTGVGLAPSVLASSTIMMNFGQSQSARMIHSPPPSSCAIAVSTLLAWASRSGQIGLSDAPWIEGWNF